MSQNLTAEMRRVIRTRFSHVEVAASPGSGKTAAAVARVLHLLERDPDSRIALLSHSNTAVDNLVERLASRGVSVGDRVFVATCHSLALRIAGVTPSNDPSTEDSLYFKAMLRSGIRALGRKTWRVTIDHLIVDEYQDCSDLQRRLIAKLAHRARTTVVLGDRMQAIYGFAGVRYRPLADLLPDAETLPLSLSHRLTRENAALANALGLPMRAPAIKTAKTGKQPLWVTAPDAPTLVQWVASRVRKLVAKGVSASKIAVLGRNRGTARPIADALRVMGVSTTLVGQSAGHMEQVLDVIAILAVVEEALWAPPKTSRRSGRNTRPGIRALKAVLHQQLNLSLIGALGDEHAERSRWPVFVAEVQRLVESGGADPGGRFGACTAAYLRLLGGIHANKAMRNDLNGWIPVCRMHPGAEALEAHARSMMTGTAVTVTNIHQAKGMEWDYVFVFGVTDGVLPDFRAAQENTIDNERSLLYVAATRPLKRLWVCHAPMFGRQAKQTFDQPSRFLVDPAMQPLMKMRRLT